MIRSLLNSFFTTFFSSLTLFCLKILIQISGGFWMLRFYSGSVRSSYKKFSKSAHRERRQVCEQCRWSRWHIQQRSIAIWAPISDYAKFSLSLPKPTCVTEQSLAGVRCVYEQTLQAYSPVCPGKVPREHVHLAHMLWALWLFGLLCADWLRLQNYFFIPF